MPPLLGATFNLHAGIDGWGRPFDVVASCSRLDADVLLLQETWTPEGGEGLASLVATSLGYEVHEVPLSDALLLEAAKVVGTRWGPRNSRRNRSLWLGDAEDLSHVRRARWGKARAGTWGIALLSRLPVRRVETIELGRLRRESAKRRSAAPAHGGGGAPHAPAGGPHPPP